MNSALYGKQIEFPFLLKKHLADSLNQLKNLDKNSEGYKRNLQLQNAKTITYPQLKRIKNFFDSFNGTVNDENFILNGGLPMKSWVDTTLDGMRKNIESIKKTRKDSGENNQFIKSHEKNSFNLRPSEKHLKIKDRHATSLGNLPSPVMESINRINEILKKIM